MSKSSAKSQLQMPDWLVTRSAELLLSDEYLVLDVEVDTSHGDWGNAVFGDNQLLLACWKRADGGVEACWGNEVEQGRLLAAVEAAKFVVAHNGKYECGWLKRCGVDLRKLVLVDTKIAEYLLQPKGTSTSLDATCKRRGFKGKDPVVDLMMGHVNPKDMPRRWLEQRCRQDVETTEQVFLQQREEFRQADRLPLLFTRCNLTPVLADIEASGMCLDPSAVEREATAARSRLLQLEGDFSALAGGINPRSRKQLGALLYGNEPGQLGFAELRDRSGKPKRTETGKQLTDQKTLAKLKATTPEQKAFVELQKELGKVQALLSKNLNFFEYVCKEQDGVLHGEFNQTVTATGRLSSSGLRTSAGSVQFQNLPRRLKPLFRARRDGWLLGEVDGSQLEFRVAAYLGQDRQAIADISDPSWDAHLTSAAAMAEVPYEQLAAAYRAGDKRAAAQRQDAKSETFKPLYGGTKGSAAQERWYAEFKRRYPGITKTQEGWVHEVLSARKLRTDWGQIFHWPEASISSQGYVNVATEVSNYPVQALATAEIIPIAVCSFWHRVADRKLESALRCINTVHDSVVCELDPAARDEFVAIAKLAFTSDVYWYLENVYGMTWNDDLPLGVGVKIGDRWGTGDETAIDIYKDGREVIRK